MKILKLATHDYLGAGKAALDSMTNTIGESKLLVLEKQSQNPNVIPVYRDSLGDRWLLHLRMRFQALIRYVRVYNPKYAFYDHQIEAASAKRILKRYGEVPDVIEVFWVSNFISFYTINRLYKLTGAHIIFIMTDDACFTGGCHYPWGCNGYKNNCSSCPALKRNSHFASRILRYKKKYLPDSVIVTGTTADCMKVEESALFKGKRVVPCVSITDSPFTFTKRAGREKWNIPNDKFVIFCGASFLEEERKGFKLLSGACEKIISKRDMSDIVLLVAGQGKIEWPETLSVVEVGTLTSEELFMAFYTADLFVSPSVEDSGPMMVNYAFEADVPIVAFRTGVSVDLISHKNNGYLCEIGNIDDLKSGIEYCIDHSMNLQKQIIGCNENIRQYIREKKSYIKFLTQLIKNTNSNDNP